MYDSATKPRYDETAVKGTEVAHKAKQIDERLSLNQQEQSQSQTAWDALFAGYTVSKEQDRWNELAAAYQHTKRKEMKQAIEQEKKALEIEEKTATEAQAGSTLMNPQDLFNDIKAIKAQLDELSKRPAPATAEQLKQINDRPITLDAKAMADYVIPGFKQATEEATKRMGQTVEQASKTFAKATQDIPRQVRVTGDIYGFTTFYATLTYRLVLLAVVIGAWILCDHYREQAEETVIYKQAQEVIRERDHYYDQIQDYKRRNPKYARLFPAYDNKGFWEQFNKQ